MTSIEDALADLGGTDRDEGGELVTEDGTFGGRRSRATRRARPPPGQRRGHGARSTINCGASLAHGWPCDTYLNVAGPRRPQATGSCWPGVAAHQRSGGSAPTIAVVAANRPVPPGAETRVVLDRRRLDRDDRGEEDEDQQHRNHHREATPERGHDDRSDRAIEAVGCVHAGETPNPSIVFRRFRAGSRDISARPDQYGWRNAKSGRPHVPRRCSRSAPGACRCPLRASMRAPA